MNTASPNAGTAAGRVVPAAFAGEVAATVYRGAAIENTHYAHVAVVDPAGTLRYRFGNPRRMTLPRSAVKPVQALAIVESGALERFALDDADLALMCASHNSEPRHLARARAMLQASGATEDELRCGPHPALSDAVWRDWLRHGFEPTPICSNCSGKHAGMLAAARALGLPVADYHRPAHPLQARVRRTLAELAGVPESALVWATDGCNLPTPSLPLDRLALVFARLASASLAGDGPMGDSTPSGSATATPAHAAARSHADAPQGPGIDSAAGVAGHIPGAARRAALARIYRAMTGYPELVAGSGRFCTALMRAYEGTLLGKTGAEACYAIGVPALGLGLAVKVEDGGMAALHAIVVAVLDQLSIGTPAMREQLAAYRAPEIRNTVGDVTGRLEVNLQLVRVA